MLIRSELRLFDGRGPRYSTASRLQLAGPLPLDAPRAAICRYTFLRWSGPDDVSDGLLHNQLLNFCQNARMAFLWRNAQVDDTIVEAGCKHRTGGGHVDWSPHLRKFANMKIQAPHFRGGFGITPNEGSAISAFYSATCALVVWLGSHGGTDLSQTSRICGRPG